MFQHRVITCQLRGFLISGEINTINTNEEERQNMKYDECLLIFIGEGSK